MSSPVSSPCELALRARARKVLLLAAILDRAFPVGSAGEESEALTILKGSFGK